MKRPIHDRAEMKIGGFVVAKFSAFADDLEIVMILKSKSNFFAVVARSRQAYRAFKLHQGQIVEVKGQIIDYPMPQGCGYKVAYAIMCEGLRVGNQIHSIDNPLSDHVELSKISIFRQCAELNQSQDSR